MMTKPKSIEDMERDELITEVYTLADRLKRSQSQRRRWEEKYFDVFKRLEETMDHFGKLNLPPEEILATARKVGGYAGAGDWKMARKVLLNYKMVGSCAKCKINLYGEDRTPGENMPCNVVGCPYERPDEQSPMTRAELAALGV